MPVMLVFLFPLARWFPPSHHRTSKSPSFRASAEQEDFDICQFLLDYRKQKELAEGVGIEVDEDEDLGNN